MERLTKRIDGAAVYRGCYGTCGTCDGTTCFDIGLMVDRLAAYEDTGLTPEEIIELKHTWRAATKAFGFNNFRWKEALKHG